MFLEKICIFVGGEIVVASLPSFNEACGFLVSEFQRSLRLLVR